MQITLNQNEIERAIITFVGNQGISITGKNVDVTLIAGRGPNGMSATIDISNDDPGHKTVVEINDEAPKSKSAKKHVAEEAEEATEPEPAEPAEDSAQSPLFGS